jgi:hypothetical protein
MKKIVNAFLILVSTVAIISCSSSEKRLLKFNLEKGKTYDYEMVMDMDQEMVGAKNKIGMIAGYAISVTDDDGNVKTLDIQYSDFKMDMNIAGQEMKIDATIKPEPVDSSNMDPAKMMSNAFTGIIGKKFIMKVDGEGKIQSVAGVQEFINGMVESMGGGADVKAMVQAALNGQFSEEKIKETFAPMFAIYPNKEVKPGDTWSSSYNLTSQAVEAKTYYTLKSFEGDNAVVEAKSKMDPLTGATNENLAGLKLNGTQTGTIKMNSKTGMVVDAELDQKFESSGSFKLTMTGKMKMKGKARN